MNSDKYSEIQITFGRVMLVIGVVGAATALIAAADLTYRAIYLNPASQFSLSDGYGYQFCFIVNQFTFAPLIISGIAFVRDWKATPAIVVLSFCFGMMPVVWYCGFFNAPRYQTFFLDFFFDAKLNPLNYGSIFVLLAITIAALVFILVFSLHKRQS